MNGVEILNQFEVATKTVFSWESFWSGAILGVLLAIFIICMILLPDWEWSTFGMMCSIFIPIASIILALLSGFLLAPAPAEYETHYEVSINEEVNMKEFMDKYDILETRGGIYTVRERRQTRCKVLKS